MQDVLRIGNYPTAQVGLEVRSLLRKPRMYHPCYVTYMAVTLCLRSSMLINSRAKCRELTQRDRLFLGRFAYWRRVGLRLGLIRPDVIILSKIVDEDERLFVINSNK